MALVPLLLRAHESDDGRGYTELKPERPVDTPGKVEVVEFFWYGCPHCYQFEPLLEVWVPKLPSDVSFRRVPAIFNDRWAHDASIFYAFDALGLVARLHRPLFDAIHRDRLRTDDPKAFAEWLRRNNVDPVRLEQTRKSFGVQTSVRRATQLSVAYRIEGVPTLAVHGRYTLAAGHGRTLEALLKTADELIALMRKGISSRQ